MSGRKRDSDSARNAGTIRNDMVRRILIDEPKAFCSLFRHAGMDIVIYSRVRNYSLG
jgi:hypothetical protein